ncbi:hypothetical protein QAD02_021316 [Eretmocerus hayati]|uniref:Uncharacterized protein n=1 Tax=Eretmocerus hayati TaxID=131215 RepID=A0ACC2PPX4_9HYME|nr:hypothetical protein QAD02_021316 [Eretmocerus hayati]
MTDNISNLLVEGTDYKEMINLTNGNQVGPQYSLDPASGPLPVIHLTKEEFPTYDEPHHNRFGYPTVENEKMINPANINKYRVAQPQKNASDISNKRSSAQRKPGKTDAKFRNSVRAFNKFLALESARSANNNMPPKQAIETITSQASTMDSTLDFKPLERSPLKIVPQPETTHSYAMDSNAFCKEYRGSSYSPIKLENLPKKNLSNPARDLGPLQRRLKKCQENIRPVPRSLIPRRKKFQKAPEAVINLTNDDMEDEQTNYEAEIFREKSAASRYEKSYWLNKRESACTEKETQMMMKKAAEMKLEYYRRKCGSQMNEEASTVEKNSADNIVVVDKEVSTDSSAQLNEE